MEINTLDEKEAAILRQWIAASERIVICAHKSPDGDAMGAALAWNEYLRQLGKAPFVVVPDAYPDFLQWLPGSERVLRYDRKPEVVTALFQQADLVFCLDFGESSRVEAMQQVLMSSPARKVMIDHHLNPSDEMDLVISRPSLCSTCELVFRIVWQLEDFERMNRKWATCVYCGMMTDTGAFTYNSNSPVIFFIISQLLTKHIDKDLIYRRVFNNYSSYAIRLRGYLMDQKLQVWEDLHAACFTLTREEMRRYHFIKGDVEGLVNQPLRIKGLKLSIYLREDTEQDNLIYVSLRSVDDFPCNEMAANFFHGGGHLNASGGKLACSLEEAKAVVERAVNAYSERLRA